MAGGFLGQMFGERPTVPVWNAVTLGQSQTKAVGENQSALPGIENLASGVDTFNQNQLTQLLNSVMPGWSDMANQSSKNTASELKGEIPTDVSQALQSSDAAKALTGGFGGSGLSGNMTAKDLGLTSLNLMQQGQSSLESWTSMVDNMFAPGQFNVSSMFVDPQTEFTDTMQNQEQQFSQQWLSNQVESMANPEATGLWSMLSGMGSGMMSGGGNSGGGGGM